MLLIILTMLGISALDSTKLETKMAANTAERNRALQTAEIGLRIPVTHDVDKIVDTIADIAARGENNPRPPEYYRLNSNNQLVLATGANDSSANYVLKVQTIRSSELYPDKSGKGKCSGDCMLNFIIISTGRSREDVNATSIMLRAGMSRIIPTGDKNSDRRNCSSTDRSLGKDDTSTNCNL
jgi:hypothetical protein